jgi:hypothetical protein
MGAVEELARDDVERKRFLKMAGRRIGADAAASASSSSASPSSGGSGAGATTGVSAYNGAETALTDKKLLAGAGSIVQVEARHAASIALVTNRSITPSGAFDKPLTTPEVLAKAGRSSKADSSSTPNQGASHARTREPPPYRLSARPAVARLRRQAAP